MKIIQAFYISILLAGLAFVPQAASRTLPPLVETAWLNNNLSTKNLVLIDVRTAANYGVGHLPGAVNIPYTQWNAANDERNCQALPEAAVFTTIMRNKGISAHNQIIIYDHANTTGDATKGAYAVWSLEAMGHKDVSYLNGGFTKWTFEGRIIDNIVPTPQPGNFTAQPAADKIATLAYVKSHIGSQQVQFVDARNSNQFFGAEKRADVARYGHIKGAINLPAPFINNAGINRAPAILMPHEKLAEIAAGMGLPKDKNRELIVYCNTGQYAALDYLVLHDILGYQRVRLYDGSMLEYAVQYELPLNRYSWGR
jgi:thiosulfate/3-mercaptopyruvate sulfurtransferase